MAPRRSIKREARDLRLYQLAASGLSYAAIAQREGISKSTVARAVREAAATQDEERKGVASDLILQRFDMVVQAHMPNVRDPRSAEVIIRASVEAARLHGLYNVNADSSTAEASSMIGQFIEGLARAREVERGDS